MIFISKEGIRDIRILAHVFKLMIPDSSRSSII